MNYELEDTNVDTKDGAHFTLKHGTMRLNMWSGTDVVEVTFEEARRFAQWIMDNTSE